MKSLSFKYNKGVIDISFVWMIGLGFLMTTTKHTHEQAILRTKNYFILFFRIKFVEIKYID